MHYFDIFTIWPFKVLKILARPAKNKGVTGASRWAAFSSSAVQDYLYIFQNNLQKYNSHISSLERENIMLLNDVKKFEQKVGL